ncbi:hypothetical protein THRCLA_00050 [Thraustotheca clavata]|uniref:CBF1-interacting co-repressor CIR N-terminal domain-containing protein n=1 Tax=Thraustotheca clavata TaxID=74557 RepID=A0A1W0ACP2_9STRA|nr:hypothetical protein THRCLA_00050 [Thraustotheca clavata]
MGGGGLRILKHKKWHVWTRENIEKVRRDERLHEESTRREFREKRKRDLDARVEMLKPAGHVELFPAEPAQQESKIQAPEGIALGGVLNPAYRHKRAKPSEPWYMHKANKDDNSEIKRDAGEDPLDLIVSRPKSLQTTPPDEDDKLDFAGDTIVTTRTERMKKKKSKQKASNRMEELRKEREEREAAERKRANNLLR